MTTIRFEEPPADSRSSGQYPSNGEVVAALKARPGEWALIRTVSSVSSATSTAYQIRSARLSAFAPAGSFEAVSRTTNGEYRVYARYVGEGGDQ